MTTIVTRAGKGSALTWTEGDSNFTNLNTAKLENVVEDTTPQLGGNLDVNGNKIVSTSNANITIEPNGTGDVVLAADTVQVGDANAAATVTTNGTGNLTINTNSGTNAGTIVLTQGANGNIIITPNGTGVVNNVGVTVLSHTPAVAGTNPVLCRSIVTIANSIRYGNLNLQKQRSDILLADMTNEPSVLTYSVRDSANVNRIFASTRAVYQGTGTNPLFAFDVSVNGYTNTIDVLNMSNSQARFGNTNTNYTITTNGTGDLTLSTNSGTNSGTVVINDGVNGNIAITPNGTGSVVLDGLSYPQADGSNGQFLTTNGSGQLSFASQAGTLSAQTAIAYGDSFFSVDAGTRRIDFDVEHYDSNGWFSLSSGAFTISVAGTFLIEFLGIFRVSDNASGMQLRNITGSANLKSLTAVSIESSGGPYLWPQFCFVHTITTSNQYDFRQTGSPGAGHEGEAILKITKLA